ncbi:F-box domain, Leucine-rich repeat domain, L domain-like protein [Artemisia annua]|uniref:F-box domain, Leucine-rich repeat domain, L domain-like protein n=1 Tax=Artemisia annua TaxID=35608 RepID=A0A2U1Q2C3_ARTAN|nr:F-box domain, Leucine-rich repeat domain, L domain-like protein [Artemisia annua]
MMTIKTTSQKETQTTIKRRRKTTMADRLSDLPEDLIHKIFSYISIKQVVETSALSSRWRFFWTSMPYLNFSSDDFHSLADFSIFVNHVFSRRNSEIQVSSLMLSFHEKATQAFVERILNCALSHNVQQLTVTCTLENDSEFPLSLCSSQSLKHLTLKKDCCGPLYWWRYALTLSSMWELPALTTLHLDRIELSSDNTGLISKCANLKNLTLEKCRMMGPDGFIISHSGLSYLKIEDWVSDVKFVSVVAPHLNYLSISGFSRDILISAPNLAYLLLESYECLNVLSDDFQSLEKVDICISCPYKEDPHRIVGLLQRLHGVKYLTLNIEILEHLSSYVGLFTHRPSPFANLKSLVIYRERVYKSNMPNEKADMSTELKNYLLHSSPSATLTIVSRQIFTLDNLLVLNYLALEDTIAVKNVTSAQDLMAKLQVLLEQEKANTGTNRAHFGRSLLSRQNYMKVEVERRKEKVHLFCLKLEEIEELLEKLPASKRAKVQRCYSALLEEFDIVMAKLTGLRGLLI